MYRKFGYNHVYACINQQRKNQQNQCSKMCQNRGNNFMTLLLLLTIPLSNKQLHDQVFGSGGMRENVDLASNQLAL